MSDKRAAVTELLIASTELAESVFHLQAARRRVSHALELAAPGSGFAAEVRELRRRINVLAETHYPEVLTEEVP